MRVKLSSKGRVVIPESIREVLGLVPGTQLDIQLVGRKIVIEPVGLVSPVDALYGKYRESDFLAALEAEHKGELEDERTR
jgi:AbrB family looped-hinge helix DNA binding protein